MNRLTLWQRMQMAWMTTRLVLSLAWRWVAQFWGK